MSDLRISIRCGAATVDIPPVEVNVTAGTGWGAYTRALTLCDDCVRQLEAWLAMPQDHQAIGGALSPTAVASMALATS